MRARGYQVNYPIINTHQVDEEWNWGDFNPGLEEMKVNVARIIQRIEMKIVEQGKERFYTFKGKVLKLKEWKEMYKKYL